MCTRHQTALASRLSRLSWSVHRQQEPSLLLRPAYQKIHVRRGEPCVRPPEKEGQCTIGKAGFNNVCHHRRGLSGSVCMAWSPFPYGHTFMHSPQNVLGFPLSSVTISLHLSTSYPLSVMAPDGQISEQIVQSPQPSAQGDPVVSRSSLVKRVPSRSRGPKSGEINRDDFPIHPNPARYPSTFCDTFFSRRFSLTYFYRRERRGRREIPGNLCGLRVLCG